MYLLKVLVLLIVLFVMPNVNAIEFACKRCFYDATNVASLTIEEKLKKVENCKQICKKDHEYEFCLADYLMYMGKPQEAEQLLKSSIKKYKDDTRKLQHMLMHLYFCYERYDELLAKANNMIKKYPEWFSGYYFKGIYNIQVNSLQEAYKFLTMAIKKENNVESHLGLVMYYYNMRDFQSAFNEYELAYNAGDRILPFMSKDVSAIAAHSAMELGRLRSAEWILDMQKRFVKDIEQYDKYQEARNRLNVLKQNAEPYTPAPVPE